MINVLPGLSINADLITHIETWWSAANKDGTLQSLDVIKTWNEKKAILRCQVFVAGRVPPLKFDGADATSVCTQLGHLFTAIPSGWTEVASMTDLQLVEPDLPF